MKRIFILCFFCVVPLLVSAQTTAPAPSASSPPSPQSIRLDIASAVSLAEKNNFSLKGTRADADGKRAAAQASWSIFYPTVSLKGNFTAGLTDPATPSAARNDLSAGLTAALTIQPTMAIQIRQAWNSYQAGLAGYDQAYAALVNNIKKLYFNLLLLGEQKANTRKQADAYQARYEAAVFKFKNGFMSEIDMLSVEYAWKSKLFSLATIENSYETSFRQLKDICGLDPEADVTLTSPLPEVSDVSVDLSRCSIDNNPDLKVLTFNKTQAEIARDNAAAALLPSLTVAGKLSGGFSADPFGGSIFEASSWTWNGSLSASIGLSIPLDAYLPYSQTRTALLLQEAAVEKAAYALADQRQAALRKADSLLLTLRQVQRQIESLSVNVSLAQRTLTLTDQLYQSGKKSFLDVKDAENSLSEAQVQLINARYAFFSALLDLEYLYSADIGLHSL